MTLEIALVLVLLAASLVLYSIERVPPDVTALGILLALVLLGLLPASKAFAGFGSDTVIMILSLLIMTAALLRTGVVELVGRALLRHTGTHPETLLAVIMGAVAVLSAFISNTAAAAFFIPVAIGVAQKAGIPQSKLLMPVAFAARVILTQPMSNQAAAAVVLPIALEMAAHLGLNPRPFAMMIAVAASCSYLTPLEPACLLVYGPGRYRFADFFRVGGPLVVLLFLVALLLVPWLWPP